MRIPHHSNFVHVIRQISVSAFQKPASLSLGVVTRHEYRTHGTHPMFAAAFRLADCKMMGEFDFDCEDDPKLLTPVCCNNGGETRCWAYTDLANNKVDCGGAVLRNTSACCPPASKGVTASGSVAAAATAGATATSGTLSERLCAEQPSSNSPHCSAPALSESRRSPWACMFRVAVRNTSFLFES